MSDTLASLRQALLPLAQYLGYTDVQVGADLTRFGCTYWASALGTYGATTLTDSAAHHTPGSMLNAAMQTLHAELRCSAAQH